MTYPTAEPTAEPVALPYVPKECRDALNHLLSQLATENAQITTVTLTKTDTEHLMALKANIRQAMLSEVELAEKISKTCAVEIGNGERE